MLRFHRLTIAIAAVAAAVCTGIAPGAMAGTPSVVSHTPSPAKYSKMTPKECAYFHRAHPHIACDVFAEMTVTEYGITVQARDEHGVVLGSQTITSNRPIGDDDQAIEPDHACGQGHMICPQGVGWKGWRASSGCRTAYAWIQEKSLVFRSILYRYEHDLRYCFSKKRITSHSDNSRITKSDGQSYLRGTSYYRYFYNFAKLGSRSGYASKATGTIERCWIKYGCVGVRYPHVNLYAHADGTWYWSTYR